MEDCSVALVTARESFVGRWEHCFCGRQLPRGREGGREGGRERGRDSIAQHVDTGQISTPPSMHPHVHTIKRKKIR